MKLAAPTPLSFTVKLNRASIEQLLDVVDCKLTAMDVIDREDQRCANALTDAKRVLEEALPFRPARRLNFRRRPV